MNDLPIAIKVTTKDPNRSYYVHFTRDTHTVIDVLDCKTIYTREAPQIHITGRTAEIIVAARSGIKTPATKEKTSEDHV